MSRKKGDLSRYAVNIPTEKLPVGEPYLSQIERAEKEDDWHMLLCPECAYRINNSKFKGKRKYLPSSMTSSESNQDKEEFMIWSISREIKKLKEDDENNGRTGHQKLWKKRASKLFDVEERTIGNWVRENDIYTTKEKLKALRPKAIALYKKLSRSK